ncbi:helicase [Leucobacter denitrificans]|uniref:Helicase n=2 Tax=Leucobacter denitrificans TaxID=683042 RepID=A0A7G9S7T0_9MICO|nr:helicase [Leucobacter denitrificans]
MAAIAAGVLIIGTPALVASNAVAAGARAASAADAAALAAADASVGLSTVVVEDPCALAAEVAERNNLELRACEVDGSSGSARVTTVARTGLVSVSRSAHAGPPEAGGSA